MTEPVREPIEDPKEFEAAVRHYLDEWKAAYQAKFPEQHRRLRDWRIEFEIKYCPD